MDEVEREVVEKIADVGSLRGFLKMHIHKPFPFQKCKNAVFESTAYNLHKGRNVRVLRNYISFWNR